VVTLDTWLAIVPTAREAATGETTLALATVVAVALLVPSALAMLLTVKWR
jgi:hypothetical protein